MIHTLALLQDIEAMFDAYGIKVCPPLPQSQNADFVVASSSSLNGALICRLVSQLPLLKVLIDRLLRGGTEELLRTLGSAATNEETQTSNAIAEYTVCQANFGTF